ncbi:response regulator [Aquisphaera insulae]|uniref:response regulator n=1 Tax=Aquisphaera insulae TaxID=2712864 RepID=UPI00196A94DC|nr:response regulator [Aquisphaera insulae]
MPESIRRAAAEETRGGLFVGLLAVVLSFAAMGGIAYWNTRTLYLVARQVVATHDILSRLDGIISLMKDAETGQRGYVLTGDDRYLDPYVSARTVIDQRLGEVERLVADNPEQAARLPAIKEQVAGKLAEMAETIEVRRSQGFEAARKIVVTDRGKEAMDAVRTQVGRMQEDERARRQQRIAEMESAYKVAIASGVLTGLLGTALSGFIAHLVRRRAIERKRQEWLQAGQIGVNEALAGDRRLEELGESVLGFLAGYMGVQAGAFFAASGGQFRRVATHGVPADGDVPAAFRLGDGLLGQAAADRRTRLIRDVPDGYLTIGSALGRGRPRHLVIAPAVDDARVNGVLEVGFLHPPDGLVLDLLDRVSRSLGVAVQSASYRTHLQDLLEETQRQAEELQAQGEELRVSNEELEEQGRALKESQVRLEQQQVELEQSNSQLEEQTAILGTQRDDLQRAKDALQVHARELARASRYKSDFLANMSHELRTPLNSSLILAKLLADNPTGNLTAEQVEYAETIRSAGDDLLTLINDILDLSKIEAGHMDVRAEPVRIVDLVDGLARVFEPLAREKGLGARFDVRPGCPETIETDRQRLDQVLKNLLSNAVKFTESGEVRLEAAPREDGRIEFAVADTGIGIAGNEQQVIFEAFRQADGTTNRKYGGTGLGLSISRELARLLGGEIRLQSEPGKGSTFTAILPRTYRPPEPRRPAAAAPPSPTAVADAAAAEPVEPAASTSSAPRPAAAPVAARAPAQVPDDREVLIGDRRTLLVVEDDEAFARILRDLAHELGFQCLVAATAEQGQAMAVQYLPSAVVLDVGLPDHSGLSVLDRLKHDARTRHIPVHVVSAGDYSRVARELGAVGYMLKPVKREELAQALRQLESRLAQRMRRVLLVEDDPVQRDSLGKLLGSHEVQTVGAGTAAECLALLKDSTFDCMVLDLSLPDASGYSLLETLSREDTYSFPPVIVYTGRDLSPEEEQRLRRYSKSIIIKGAKSPERLLDEVTLFLHQVVSELPAEQQVMLEKARSRDATIEGRRVLVVEDDVRNVFALMRTLESRGAVAQVARNGREAIAALEATIGDAAPAIDLVLMDVMMPEMDGLAATAEIRNRPEWKKLPIIMLTAKAMKDDQERCLAAGADDYMAKPLDVEKLLSLVRVWMPR